MNAQEILSVLAQSGHEALIVGGAVRDTLMGLQPNDYDIATSASPQEVIDLLSGKANKIDLVGVTFNVVIVDGIEVATFRGETYSVPGKPTVHKVKTFKEDASRRDFTINAMGIDRNKKIIDPFGGQEDIKNKVIRCVGEPEKRFTEDPCRLIRAVTFAARFGFTIEARTAETIRRMSPLAETLPPQRVSKEIKKALDRRVLSRWLEIAADLQLLPYILPELAHLQALPQNQKFHDRDAWKHTLAVVAAAEEAGANTDVVLAATFHDCAKGLPGVRQDLSDIGHELAGAEIAHNAIVRLGFGCATADRVAFLVKNHMIRPSASYRSLLRAIRKMTADVKNKQELRSKLCDLFVLLKADASGFNPGFAANRMKEIAAVEKIASELISSVPLFISELPINGRDLQARGFTGPQIGLELKNILLDEQSKILACLKK